jgi:multimeric flavodoxin WrbA
VRSTGRRWAIQGPALKTRLIVFHSLTGGARQMAKAAAAGAASEPEVTVRLLTAADCRVRRCSGCRRYIFATPENLAAMAGRMKDFFDRTYYPALDRINGRPYATLICPGSDGRFGWWLGGRDFLKTGIADFDLHG